MSYSQSIARRRQYSKGKFSIRTSLVAWTRRSYRKVSAASLVLLVAALLYFVTPVDVIPDALGVLGFVDDLAVIQTAVETVREELEQFREWEKKRAFPPSS